ncbi:MAG: transposase, partial [Anaerostipes sp.]|nr:transposase [Anaerostipes sp.]
SCEGCPHKKECCPRASGNRMICMNQELTSIHQEVLSNLESIHGALLRMNRSIQAEGTFGILKWDKSYKRLFRRGEKNVILELTLISCGFNLYKYHNKMQRKELVA